MGYLLGFSKLSYRVKPRPVWRGGESGGVNRPPGDPAGLGAREAVIWAASGEPVGGERRLHGEPSCDETYVIDCIDGVDGGDRNGDELADGGNMATCPRCEDASLVHALDDPDAHEEFESTVTVDDMASARWKTDAR